MFDVISKVANNIEMNRKKLATTAFLFCFLLAMKKKQSSKVKVRKRRRWCELGVCNETH